MMSLSVYIRRSAGQFQAISMMYGNCLYSDDNLYHLREKMDKRFLIIIK